MSKLRAGQQKFAFLFPARERDFSLLQNLRRKSGFHQHFIRRVAGTVTTEGKRPGREADQLHSVPK